MASSRCAKLAAVHVLAGVPAVHLHRLLDLSFRKDGDEVGKPIWIHVGPYLQQRCRLQHLLNTC